MRSTLLVWMVILAALSGCTRDRKVAEVPPAPVRKLTTLDHNLRNAARQELLDQCDSTDQFLRANALEAISDVDPSAAGPAILKALSDPEPSVRYAAALSAGRIQLKSAYATLLGMLHDSDPKVEVGVRFALHRLGNTENSHDLEKFAQDFDATVRACTAQVLGLLGEKSAVYILYALDKDARPAVRIQAAEALWRLGDQKGYDDLVVYTVSAYPDDQIVAMLALAAPRDNRVMSLIRGGLTSDYTEVNLAAARAMGMLGSDSGWFVAVPAAKSTDPRQRSLAALAMGAIGRPDLQKILGGLLKDPSPEVRISAATGILQLHE